MTNVFDPIPADLIDLWEIPLQAVPLENCALGHLSSDERNRFDRFQFPRHKRRFAQARMALRTILGHYLHVLPASIQFEYTAHGKPYLPLPHQLQFNLSHSKDLALLAVCKHYPIGVDLEYFSTRPFQGIAGQLFSIKEQQTLLHLPASLKPLGFFSVWAQKEAIMKAVGLGLSYPTTLIDVPLLPTATYTLSEPETQQDWLVTPFMPYPGVSAAICYDPSLTTLRYFHYDPTPSTDHTPGLGRRMRSIPTRPALF